ncbi:MAG: Rpn family recombination-promoting nuclease/putative transposase [Tannerella sp.]|jgi:predicted transposase/invertase (TIGR01784 family)|nr:Rpn family recombination-promoting nuclease/putative transposase [Tannerella sp.]
MTTDKSKERPLVSFDWALKRLLRNKASFEVVEGFLSVLLGRQITVTGILESESNKEHPDDKFNRVDVVVEDDAGEIILIELQFIMEMDYFHRMLYGTSKAVVDNMVKGTPYVKIRKIYSINIVYFDLGQGTDYVYNGRTEFKGMHSHEILQLSVAQREKFGKTDVGDLYPEYYILKINNFDDVAKTPLDEWIYFLKHDRIRENFHAQGLRKALELLDYSRLSPEEKAEFDYEWSIKSHNLSQMATSLETGRLEAKKVIEEKDKTIEEQAKAIEERDREIEELKRLLSTK